MKRYHALRTLIGLCLVWAFTSLPSLVAQVTEPAADALATESPKSDATKDVQKEDGWIVDADDSQRRTFELTLHPKAEVRPALKYRLIPDRYDQVPGNAAVYYLKAMGFFEETMSRRAIDKYDVEAAEQPGGFDERPPYVWLGVPPRELPIDEVKKFLEFLSFQKPYLEEARLRRSFQLDRNIRQVDDPIAYLLPEIQVMRQLARYQGLRSRVAIAEGRFEDAIASIGVQYSLAYHLGSDEFFVSTLVGSAVAAMAWNDLVHLTNEPEAPNLYWAIASLPNPLINMREAASFERQFLFEQVKCLREVTEKVRPAGYWQDFMDRFEAQMGPILVFEGGFRVDGSPDDVRAATVAFMGAAYPGAKKFLIQEAGMSSAKVESYPRIQAVLLAMKRYYEFARDEQFKWDFVPYAQSQEEHALPSMSERWAEDEAKYGWITKPAGLLLPALAAIRTAQQRNQQQIALLQTIESLRVHAANHHGQFPESLDDLLLPAPLDPISGEAFQYEVDKQTATLTGAPNSLQYRFVIRMPE